MSGAGEDAPRRFDVAVNPDPPARDVVEAEPEDEKKRDAALASTFDPALAHDGKTGEQLIEERQAQDRLVVDLAIAAAVIIAASESENADEAGEPAETGEVGIEETTPAVEDGDE